MQFNFFNHTPVARTDGQHLSCAFPHQQLVYAGDSTGWIHISDSSLVPIQSWQAHASAVVGLRVVGQFLVSVAENVKIWDLNRIDESKDDVNDAETRSLVKALHCCRVLQLKSTVSAWTVLPNLSHLLVGTIAGHLISYRGDLTRDRTLKIKTLIEPGKASEPITNVAFELDKSTNPNIYMTTPSKVYKLSTATKEPPKVVDDVGCEPGLLLEAHEADTLFYLAREGGLQAFGPMGPTFTIPMANDYGRKQLIVTHRGYIGVVTRLQQGSLLTLYDPRNKFVGFSGVFTDDAVSQLQLSLKQDNDAMDPLQLATAGKDVQDILLVISTSSLLVVTPTMIHKLVEKQTTEQLDLLYKRHMYPLAIQLVSDDKPLTREIYQRYGDYLYSRGEYSASVKAYIETIDTLSPSHVIRKFLDAARLNDLVEYLEALFERSKDGVSVTKEHTTLLLNCYVRLKNMQKLDKILTWKDVNFDVETAVNVLKTSFPSHALALTRRYGMHTAHVGLLVNSGKMKEALTYVEQCKRPDQEDLIQRFGNVFMQTLPAETARLITHLSSGRDYAKYFPLFVGHNDEAIKFLESVKAPRLQRAAQIGHAESGLQMMEIENEELWDVTPHLKKLNTTLLGLYLDTRESASKYAAKVLELLKTGECDIDQALISCKAVDFQDGINVLNEERGRYRDLVQSLIVKGDDEAVYKATLEYGTMDSSVYVLALDHFATNDKLLKPLLQTIDDARLLPPLVVIERLKKRGARVGVVKDYLKASMKRMEEAIVEDDALIEAYKRDTVKMQSQIKELQSGVVVFQTSKCQACGQPLSLPSLHYYCHHAYHISCLGEDDRDCPRCAPEHRMVVDLAKGMHVAEEEWRRQLEASTNWETRFDVIAQGFSKPSF